MCLDLDLDVPFLHLYFTEIVNAELEVGYRSKLTRWYPVAE